MAGNVIRKDVVQIGFEVDESPVSSLERTLNGIQSDVKKTVTTADKAANEVSQLGNEFKDAAKSADKLGDEVKGAAISADKLGNESIDELSSDLKKAASSSDKLSKSLNESSNKSKSLGNSTKKGSKESKEGIDELTGSVKDLATAASGVLSAFAFNAIIQNVSEVQQAVNKLQAQTGASASETLALGDSVKELYRSGIGQSIGEVADTTALVNQQFKQLDTDTMQSITQNAMVMADTFGTDVNETLRGVNALMVNMGLSAEEAFDYIAKGTQNGLDKSGELSDNIAEYSQLWAQAGFSAEEMFSILQNGLDSGAYNLDKVNDFVKEFAISLSDGRIEDNIGNFSERTQELFAQWQKGGATQKEVFQSVISDLSSMTNQQEALTIASNVWSALGEDNAMKVITSLNNVNDTYSDVKGTMESINEVRYDDIGTSFENLKRSANGLLTETLTPAVSSLNNVLSDGLNWLTEFAQEHEALAQGIAVATAAAGLLTVGLIAVAGAVTVVKVAVDALNISSGGILKIVGLVIGGVSLLAGAIVGLTKYFSDGEEEVEDYNGTLSECRSEIKSLEAAHKKAAERYGENSDAAKDLEKQIETLNAQYEKGGGYVAELQQRVDETSESYNELSKSQQDSMSAIDSSRIQGLQAVSMLEALSSKAEITSTDLDTMSKYADYLNDTFNCNIVVDYDTGELTGFDPKAISQTIIDAANDNRVQQAMDYLSGSEFTNDYIDQYKNLIDIQAEKKSLQVELDQIVKNAEYTNVRGNRLYTGEDADKINDLKQQIEDLTTAESDARTEVDKMNASMDEYGAIVDSSGETTKILRESLQDAAESGNEYIQVTKDAAEASSDFQNATSKKDGIDAATAVIGEYSEEIYNLCAAYDEAYVAAQESFSGQFGLFDTAQTDAEATVAAAQAALDSQLSYWKSYSSNIETLKSLSASDLGITQSNYDALIAYASSGSEEAAGLVQSMVDNINSGNTDAVAELATTIGEVQSAQDTAASNTAAWQTHMDQQMQQTVTNMQNAVNDLNLSGEAAAAASSTMNAYINEIQNKTGSAVSAAQSVVSSVKAVFESASLSFGSGGVSGSVSVQGNASGTTDSDDVFIAGEKGAELVVGKQGSTVFPASETNKIISAVQDYAGGYRPDSGRSSGKSVQSNTTYAPQFVLNMNGASATDGNKRIVKKWIKEAFDEMFNNLASDNRAVVEV